MQTFEQIIDYFNSIDLDYYISVDKRIMNERWSKPETINANPRKKGEYIGFVLKDTGYKIDNEYMALFIDIDAKRQYGNTEQEQIELFNDVIKILNISEYYPYIEKTINGGYHIGLKVSNEDYKKLNFNSVVVEKFIDDDGKLKNKKEIEIFWASRYLVTTPSKDYSMIHGSGFMDFKKFAKISFNKLEMLQSLGIKEDVKNFDNDVQTNSGTTDSYLKKSFTNIPEIKAFRNGEWQGYNFVENEIMRFFICLNKEDEFLNIIESNWPEYLKTWLEYPIKFLNKTDGNRLPSKNSKHLDWLKKIGYLKIENKKDKLLEKMENIFKKIAGTNTLKVGDSIFIYNGKSFEWLDPTKYDKVLYSEFSKQNKTTLKKEEMSELLFHFSMYLFNSGLEYNPADKLFKPSSINLAFNNGTLYIRKNETEFKENYFNPDDKVFIEFKINYSPNYTEGLLTDWVNTRFDTNNKKKFFKMIIGDLFSTNINTDVHGYFWGGSEIGKSTFASLLQKVTTSGTVDSMKLDKIKEKFSRVRTLRTPILIADESSERNIPESEYKSTISREPDDYEMKNVQNFTGQPIAKILTFANILPNIKIDEGVKRRLCVLQVKNDKVSTHLSKQDFGEEFGKCENELIGLIVEGIKECYNINWDLSGFYKDNFEEEQTTTIFVNDNFSYFLKKCFILNKDFDKSLGVTSMDAFEIYNNFLNTLAGTAMNKMSVTKFGMKLRELGIDRKKYKIGDKTINLLKNVQHTEVSLQLLLENYQDEKNDLKNNTIRCMLTNLKKDKSS